MFILIDIQIYVEGGGGGPGFDPPCTHMCISINLNTRFSPKAFFSGVGLTLPPSSCNIGVGDKGAAKLAPSLGALPGLGFALGTAKPGPCLGSFLRELSLARNDIAESKKTRHLFASPSPPQNYDRVYVSFFTYEFVLNTGHGQARPLPWLFSSRALSCTQRRWRK